jgi:predicted Zn-dependent protease
MDRPCRRDAPRPDPLPVSPRRWRDSAPTTARAALASLAFLALLASPFGCATNPVTGRREFSLVSAGQEERIGREGYGAVLAEYGSYEDSTVQRYVSEVGQRVARVSHLPDLEWHFTVIDDPAVNAFAMPGGYIYVTRGILAHLNSEAQLAGVLGHEIGHVTHRHSAEQLTRQQVTGIGLGVAALLSPTASRYGEVAQQALGLMFLKFSRGNETEADQLGVDYATRAGYDPDEIPPTYTMLQRVGERGGQRLPGFLSTHPDPGDRQVRTAELARAARAGKTGLAIRRTEHLQRLSGLLFGSDPRQGYFEGDEFYHPGLGFALTLPAGWSHQNARTAVTAVAPQQRASMQLSLADAGDRSPVAYVAKLAADGRISGSRGGTESIGGFPAWVGRVAVPTQGGGERVLAAAFLRASPDRMFQILGQTGQPDDADFGRVLASVRSFRPLTDPARLRPSPARVRVTSVARAGTFSSVVTALGAQGLELEETAILNDRDPGEVVSPGELIKTVSPAKLH